MLEKSASFYETMSKRRTIRKFSSEEIPEEVVKNIIRTAGTGPSVGNIQPWIYVIIKDPEVKQQISDIVGIDKKDYYFQNKSGKKIIKNHSKSC